MGENLQQRTKLLNNCVMNLGGCRPLHGAIYMYTYDHDFQISSSLKPHGQSKPNFKWMLLGKCERKYRSHDQDGRYDHIWQNLQKSSSS